MIEDANLSADRLALYWLAEGHAHYSFARFRTALECFDRADRVIAANDLGRRRLVAGTWRCQCLAMSGEVRESEAVASSLQPLASGLPSFVEALYRWAVGIVEHQAGQLDQSIESGATAVALNRRSGSPISAALWLPRLCVRLMEVGRTGAAIELLGDPALTENSVAYSRHRAGLTLIHAWAALSNGDRDAAATALRDALSCARDARERIRLRWFVPALVELLPFGLEQGIAPDVIGSLVSAFGIDPPSDGFEPWPWPVRIATLGRFEVSVNGTPLVFGRKMPRRTLALLVALVAAGGRHVSESRLSDALWPDLDGDAAHESFASALHRLRRLLGGNDRILQTGRTLSLNSSRCFVDTWALELALRSPDGIARTLALYRGPFMPEDDAPGTVAHRQSLRARVARAVQIRATDLRSTGLHEAAEALLNRIADADPALFDRYPPHDGHVQCDP